MAEKRKYESVIPGHWVNVPDAAAMVALLRKYSFWGLAGADGCICGSIEVFGISVDVSCRKSSDGVIPSGFYGTIVRVVAHHIYASESDVRPVAEEMVRQVHEGYAHLPVYVLFTECGKDANCRWCGADTAFGVPLCSKCISTEDAAKYKNLVPYRIEAKEQSS